jgi:Ca-activated chloride channel family protein
VLKPGTRSGHDINVTVEIDAGVPISQVRSPSHQLVSDRDRETVRVSLAPNDTIPNKDLILRYRVSDRNTRATVLTQADDRGGHFALYLIPAIDYNRSEIVPKDVVFLMDTSGSQRGEPLAKSKELMRRFIRGLNPDDTFTIIDFANATQQLSSTPLANTRSNRDRAMAYIDRLDARGGTELLNGIQTVLSFPEPESGRLRSVVLLTDGYIGNEAEVIAEVQRRLKSGNRLYSFGVGSSVNRFLLDRLAEVGRGIGRVIRHDEPTQEVAETFFRRINNPVLTDIQLRWEGNGEPPQIYPLAPPDLFDSQPLVLFGRQPDARDGKLVVTGTLAGGDRYEKTFDIDFNRQSGNVAIAQLWGRAKIKDLMTQMYGGETTEGVEAVTQTALNYRLLSKYTAFVAVTEEVRVDPNGETRRVEVPVELPEGVSYEGIFGEEAEAAADLGTPRLMSGAASRGNVRPTSGSVELQRIRRGGSQPAPQPQAPIEIIDSQGLDANAIADLTRHLQQLSIPANLSGELVFEFPVRNNRVVRVMLDEGDSTLSNETLIQEIRRSLLRWTPPSSVTGTVRVKLRIN